MTERLYYSDAYLTTFRGRVIEASRTGDNLAVVLDRTAFYPTSGGQPHDTGMLGGVPVLDVEQRDSDDSIVHLLPPDAVLPQEEIEAEIDWDRRFDHMQQHTGQHILSQAFIQTAGADTVGFHLSDTYSSIDLNTGSLAEEQVANAQTLANRVVFEDRRIITSFVPPDRVAELPLRKPPVARDVVRIVNVEDFDWSACGGTHVARTGAVGLIKVTRVERKGAETRLTFLCGGRALADYGALEGMTTSLARSLSVGVEELPATLQRMLEEIGALREETERQKRDLLDYEAVALRADHQVAGGVYIVSHVFEDRDVGEVRLLAKRIVDYPDHVALMGIKGKKAQLIFARGAGLPYDMRVLLQQACRWINGKGGGDSGLAQGGGSDPAGVDGAIRHVAQLLRLEVEGET